MQTGVSAILECRGTLSSVAIASDCKLDYSARIFIRFFISVESVNSVRIPRGWSSISVEGAVGLFVRGNNWREQEMISIFCRLVSMRRLF